MNEDIENAAFDENGKWVKKNIYDSAIYYRLCKHYKIMQLCGRVLEYITDYNDRAKMSYKPNEKICYLSYDDITIMYDVSKNMAIKAISQLLNKKLIERVNDDERTGKSKSGYISNILIIRNTHDKIN